MDKSSSLGYPCHPKKYSRGTSVKAWGCPSIPFFINKNIRSFLNTLYFYCFIYYMLFLEHHLFLFSVCFFCCNKQLDPSILVWERDTLRFHCIEHSSFHSYCSAGVLVCQYCFQLQFSTHILFRAGQYASVIYDYLSGLCWLLSMRFVSNKLIGVGDE